MISYRNVRLEDIPAVKAWPAYPPEFAGLDYSLRDGGWLDEYYPRPGTDIVVAEKSGEMAGFAILAREPPATAELRIALHLFKGLRQPRIGIGGAGPVERQDFPGFAAIHGHPPFRPGHWS